MGASCFDTEDGTTGIRIQERVRASPCLAIVRSATIWLTTFSADSKTKPPQVMRVLSSGLHGKDWPTDGALAICFL